MLKVWLFIRTSGRCAPGCRTCSALLQQTSEQCVITRTPSQSKIIIQRLCQHMLRKSSHTRLGVTLKISYSINSILHIIKRYRCLRERLVKHMFPDNHSETVGQPVQAEQHVKQFRTETLGSLKTIPPKSTNTLTDRRVTENLSNKGYQSLFTANHRATCKLSYKYAARVASHKTEVSH